MQDSVKKKISNKTNLPLQFCDLSVTQAKSSAAQRHQMSVISESDLVACQ